MAAIGLVQFERYSEMLKKREGYVAIYNKAIDALNTCLDTEYQVAYLDHKSDNHCSSITFISFVCRDVPARS